MIESTRPRSEKDPRFFTALGRTVLTNIEDIAIALRLGESAAARGERRARTEGPDPAACDDPV